MDTATATTILINYPVHDGYALGVAPIDTAGTYWGDYRTPITVTDAADDLTRKDVDDGDIILDHLTGERLIIGIDYCVTHHERFDGDVCPGCQADERDDHINRDLYRSLGWES